MQFLRADTATTVLVGPFLDKTDGVTPETTVTLGAADSAEIMKHDGTTFQDISALTFTHKAHGMYTLAITAGFLDTEGRLTVFISDESVCLPVWAEYMVVNANVYDSLFAAATTDYLQVDTIQVTGTGQTANDMSGDIDTILSRVIGTLAAGTHNPQTGDAYARLGAPAGASIAADLVVIDNFVDDLETRLSAARAGYLDNLNIAENVAGTSEISGLNDPTAAAIADAVWDELSAGHTDAGKAGQQLWTDVDAILDDTGTAGVIVATNNDKTGYALSTAGVDAIWDDTEAITGDGHSYEELLSRIFMILAHKMNVTDADGSVALRNTGDSGNVATGSITDDDTTTVRAELTWV